MKQCRTCKKENVRERNGIAVSKFCVSCREIKSREKKLAHQQTKTYLKARFKTLHKKAWKLFSEYIRRKNADEGGWAQCFTCPTNLPWDQLQAGHYFHGKLDFDERNVRPQCPQCNLYRSGNLAYYGVKLAIVIGVEGMEQLRLDANTVKYTIADLEAIIEDISSKLRSL